MVQTLVWELKMTVEWLALGLFMLYNFFPKLKAGLGLLTLLIVVTVSLIHTLSSHH